MLLRMSRFAGFDAGRLYRIAELQLRIDSAGDAIYALEKALQADPDFLTARVLLIDSQRRLGRLGAARDGALLAIQLRPGHPAGYRLLGDVESALGRPSAALENHRKALELRRQTPYLLKVFESLSAIGELEPARQLLTDWVTDNPDDYRARQVLADSHLRVGDLTAARDEYERLLEINQDAPYVLNNLANVLDKIGDDRALDYARRAHQLAADDPAVNDTLGWMLVRRGQPEEGLTYLREAQARAASSPEIRYHVPVRSSPSSVTVRPPGNSSGRSRRTSRSRGSTRRGGCSRSYASEIDGISPSIVGILYTLPRLIGQRKELKSTFSPNCEALTCFL